MLDWTIVFGFVLLCGKVYCFVWWFDWLNTDWIGGFGLLCVGFWFGLFRFWLWVCIDCLFCLFCCFFVFAIIVSCCLICLLVFMLIACDWILNNSEFNLMLWFTLLLNLYCAIRCFWLLGFDVNWLIAWVVYL